MLHGESACERCRLKRSKCDHQQPCKRCVAAHAKCVYSRKAFRTKRELCDEISALQRLNKENQELLATITSFCDSKTLEAIRNYQARATLHEHNDVAVLQCKGQPMNGDINGSPSTAAATTISGSDASASLSSLSYNDATARTPAAESSFLDTLCDTAVAAKNYPGTAMGWDIATTMSNLSSTLHWDYFPFCFICKEFFIQDLLALRSEYCSPILVNSLLALALRSSNSSLHMVFFQEARSLMEAKSPDLYNLPDIQAMGILCLYQMSCKQMDVAQVLASTFVVAASGLFTMTTPAKKLTKVFECMRSMTYCGAISLYRIQQLLANLATNKAFVSPTQLNGVWLEDVPDAAASNPPGANIRGMFALIPLINTAWSQSVVQRLVAAKLYQLIEWVYNSIALQSVTRSADSVREIYNKCLAWYEDIIPFLNVCEGGSQDPSLIVVHLLYQFCLISLFQNPRNLRSIAFEVAPDEIHREAAESILRLTASYTQAIGKGSNTGPSLSLREQLSAFRSYSCQMIQTEPQEALQQKLDRAELLRPTANPQIAELPHIILLISEQARMRSEK